jgi:uncharacterized protein YjbI with pentapeptide repeats
MITVTLYRSDLIRNQACSDSLKIFDAIAGMQSVDDVRRDRRIKVRWSPLHRVWLSAAYPHIWAWLYARGLVPDVYLGTSNLRCADLSGADLSGANLRGANLRYADLRYADLSGANLRGANLRGANLRGADLRGANLRGANLRYVDLIGADLGGANLRGANLRGANLRGADLRYVDLIGADLGDWERNPDDGMARKRVTTSSAT